MEIGYLIQQLLQKIIYICDYPGIEIVKDKEFNSAIDYHMNYWKSRKNKK